MYMRRVLRSESDEIPILNGCKEETFAKDTSQAGGSPSRIIKLTGRVFRRREESIVLTSVINKKITP